MQTVRRLAQVVVDVRAKALDRPFDYLVEADLVNRVRPGQRVLVPFGRGTCVGYVLSVSRLEDAQPLPEGVQWKPIRTVLDEVPVLSGEFLELLDWLCHRTVCTRLEAIEAILPAPFRQDQEITPTSTWLLEPTVSPETLATAAAANQRRAPKRAALLRALMQTERPLLRALGLRPSDPVVQAITAAGYAQVRRIDQFQDLAAAGLDEPNTGTAKTLTAYQDRALSAISKALAGTEPQLFVMHGVTGSGKTEVYLQAIAECLRRGDEAIVLVPEISLTPQMVGRFTARFGRRVAVLHSQLTPTQRKDEWIRLRRGEASIAVGARSAVFAPLSRVKLIIVDEEHESSYKQDETPRYDAREVAEWRSRYHIGTVVFGSATPSLTAMQRVNGGDARLLSLPTRVNGQPLPPVTIVDMREELKQGNRHLFSAALQAGLAGAVDAGHQAILFLNRRGFASFVLCRNCGDVVQCPRCDISLTLHKVGHESVLSCHYCQYACPYPEVCPTCDDPGLRSFGVGTQQVEQALRDTWPSWRVLRLDVDTAKKRDTYRSTLQAFLNGEADVLVGTQMVAKGLDLPKVTFVGVVAADTMLSVPDYRSAERTFNLLTQVAGRAGRAEHTGHTVIQTFRPEHYAIACAARHDYSTFYRQETEYRQAFDYPPYRELTTLLAVHKEEKYAKGAAERFEREVRRGLSGATITILPASPAGILRVDEQFRYQVVIKYEGWNDVRAVVARAYALVYEKIHRLGGYCVLDVNAGRIG